MFRMAHFCRINGEISRYSSQGKHQQLIVCSVHGTVEPVPYYTTHTAGVTTHDPVWTCLQCFEKWVNDGPVLVAVNAGVCHRCSSDQNVKNCEMCGFAVCDKHLVESVCDECYDCVGRACG